MKTTNLKQINVVKQRKIFQQQRRWHDQMLVLNMSIFNFDGGWNRIFSPITQRENVYGAHAPRGSFSAPSQKRVVSFRGKLVVIMNPARSSTLVSEVPVYAALQREMHDALRAQHPGMDSGGWQFAGGVAHSFLGY